MPSSRRLIGWALLCVAQLAHAQESQEPAPEALPVIPVPQKEEAAPAIEEAPGTKHLDDVVVTATKRAKSAREIPVTVNAIYGAQLEKEGARDIRDYITKVPGITMQDGNYGEAGTRKITIRGVGPAETAGQGGNQTVGQFIGDVPLTDPFSNWVTPDLDPFDLKTIEILKGPQGTTFGASALNGAIRFVPNAPELDHWGGRAFVDYLDVSEGEAKPSYGAALNVPIGSQAAIRGTGVIQNSPGVIDNLQRGIPDADGRDKWSARAMLRWAPTDALDLNLVGLKQEAHLDDLLRSDDPGGRMQNNNHPGPSYVDIGFELAGLDARYAFDSLGTLVLQSAFQRKTTIYDVDTGATGAYGTDVLRGYVDIKTHGSTHELRLVSPDGGKWNWIGGLFFLDDTIDAYVNAYLGNTQLPGLSLIPPLLSALPGLPPLPGLPALPDLLPFTPQGLSAARAFVDFRAREKSAYGEISRKLFERWELTLGARYYITSLKGGQKTSGPATVAYLQGTESKVDQEDRGLSPKVSLAWRPTRDLMAYATVARGFQFGGINPPPLLSLPQNNPATGTPVPVDFRSSNLWSYELGVRTDWFHRTLRADLTGFYLDWTDAQFGLVSGGSVQSNPYIDNVGKVHVTGAEATLAWLTPVPGVSLNAAAAYIRSVTAAKYDDGAGHVVPSGSPMPGAPKLQTAETLAYNRAFGTWLTNASLSHSYWGPSVNNFTENLPIYDFHTMDLNLSVAKPDWLGMPSLVFGITNLTDTRAVMNRAGAQGTGSIVSPMWTYSRPRTFLIRVTAEFN